MMRHFRLVWAVAFVLLQSGACAADDDFARDADSTYLSDLPDAKPIILKVDKTTPVYADRTRNAMVKSFAADETVLLLAYNPDTYLVKNTQSGYEGWVPAENLSKPPKEDLAKLMLQVDEERKFAAAIKKHEILPGMTFAHVLASLGKPNGKTFREDEHGRLDKWSYTDYETQYQNQYQTINNSLVMVQVPVRVPVGSLNVEFKAGHVTAFEKTRTQ